MLSRTGAKSMRAEPRRVEAARNVGRRWLIGIAVLFVLPGAGLMAWRINASQESEGFGASVAVENQTTSELTLEAQTVAGEWVRVGIVAALEKAASPRGTGSAPAGPASMGAAREPCGLAVSPSVRSRDIPGHCAPTIPG